MIYQFRGVPRRSGGQPGLVGRHRAQAHEDAGIDPDHAGQAAVVERIRTDTARCGPVIRQTRIRAERRARNVFDCF
jgi:hypothetical protein